MKERRLVMKMADVKEEEMRLKKAKEEVDTATAVDKVKIRILENRRKAREIRERHKKESWR
jgi:hypothetical protein